MSNEDTPPRATESRTPSPISIGGGWAFLYVLLAVAFAGTTIYLLTIRKAVLTEPSVLISGLGALWFVGRAFMTMNRRRP